MIPTPSFRVMLLTGAVLLTGARAAPAQAPSPASPTAVTLAAGTPFAVVLARPLTSGQAKPGQAVEYTVAGNVTQGSVVVIFAGTPALGTVAQSRSAGAFGRAGTLRLTCDAVLLPSGVRVPVRVRTAQDAAGHSNSGAAGVTGTVIGAAVGAAVYVGTDLNSNFFNAHPDHTGPPAAGIAAGLATGFVVAALFHGGNVTLPAGHPLAVVVARDTPIAAAQPAPVSPRAGPLSSPAGP